MNRLVLALSALALLSACQERTPPSERSREINLERKPPAPNNSVFARPMDPAGQPLASPTPY